MSLPLPIWVRSIRFRLTLVYSSVLFALAALLVASLYFGLKLSIRDEPVSRAARIRVVEISDAGSRGRTFVDVRQFERQVNANTLDNLRTFAFASLGALFLASLGVGWLIAGRVLSPIARITSVANEIQARNLTRRIQLAGPDDELRRLADTFDSMLDRLESAFVAQRQFLADVSHELRNPLAIIQSNLEVALRDAEASPASRGHAAAAISRTIARMTRLTDDLLALARLEHAERGREPVDLVELLHEGAGEFGAAATARELSVELPTLGALVVSGERDLLKRALANLLDNAVRLAPEGSVIRLAAGRRSGWAWFAVADQGPGVDAADRARIFGRFWRRGGGPRSGGSGLGLAIVQQIAERHAGEARVFSDGASGSSFVVWLPQNPEPGAVPDIDPVGRAPAPDAVPVA